MNKAKRDSNILIMILLILSIMLLVLSIFINSVVLNKNTYIKLLEESDTYTKVEEVIYKKMDSLLGSDSNEGIKRSIITPEDVKREADNVLTCILGNLKTGQSNLPVIETSLYKERVADILKSFTSYGSSSNNDLNINDKFQVDNMVYVKSNFNFVNMVISNKNAKDISNSLKLEELATRAEIEAKGREILKQKGMSEAEARKKLAEKGMTEEQVWNILKEKGYLDDEGSSESNPSNDKISNADENNSNNESKIEKGNVEEKDLAQSDNSTGTNDGKLSQEKVQKIIGSIITDNSKTFEEKIDTISNRLLEEAGTAIDDEIEKLNFNKLIKSTKFNLLAKSTSIFHKFYLVFMTMPIVLVLILIKLNVKKIKEILTSIAISVTVSGLIFSLFFGSIYILKPYKNITLKAVYLIDMLLSTMNYFLEILLISGIIIFIIGLTLFIPKVKYKFSK